MEVKIPLELLKRYKLTGNAFKPARLVHHDPDESLDYATLHMEPDDLAAMMPRAIACLQSVDITIIMHNLKVLGDNLRSLSQAHNTLVGIIQQQGAMVDALAKAAGIDQALILGQHPAQPSDGKVVSIIKPS